jgi:hypothetical protein
MNKKVFSIAFYSIVAACILFIFLSNPFLRLPYDPWDHLLRISSINAEGTCFFFWPDNKCPERILWHEMWAYLFKITGIRDIFLWAKIIHVTQFLLSALILYYFSKTVLMILAHDRGLPVGDAGIVGDKEQIRIKVLSLFAVFLWFIGNGTRSLDYQQAWIMWYSVTHQGLTIPLFWYSCALTLRIIYNDMPLKKILFFITQIAGASFLLAKIHPSELLYYLITVIVLLMVGYRKILKAKNWIMLVSSALSLFFIIFVATKYFMPEQVPLINILASNRDIGQVLVEMKALGHETLSRWNRFPNSFSEIALISLCVGLFYRIIIPITSKKRFSITIYDYVLLTSVIFFLIPVVPVLAGLAGFVTLPDVVWRFVFASPWFVILPFILYKVLSIKEIEIPKAKFIGIFAAACIVIFILIHQFRPYVWSGALKGNFNSIINSVDKGKVGVQYSQAEITQIGKIIEEHERVSTVKDKKNIYFIPDSSMIGWAPDAAYIVRGVYGKYVYTYRRERLSQESFYQWGFNKTYNLIELDLPANLHQRR